MTTLMFWNLFESAQQLRAGDDAMWQRQVALIRGNRPDVLAITEGWEWHLDDQALFRRAVTDFGFADAVLYEAKSGCNMAVMWRDGIAAVDVRPQPISQAWWHGYVLVTLRRADQPEPFVVMVSHLNPFDPTLRRIEGAWLRTMMLPLERGILVLDANAVPPGDPEPDPCLSRNLPGELVGDRTPLAGLAQIGLVDVGAHFDDRRPTFGYYDYGSNDTRSPVRIDQAWASPSVELIRYDVIDSADVDPSIDAASDHRAIWIEFA